MHSESPYPNPSVLASFVLERFPEPVVVLDQAGSIIQSNRAAQGAQLEGLQLFEPGRESEARQFLDPLRADGQASLLRKQTSADGRVDYILLRGFAIDSWFVVTARDVSDLHAPQEELYQLRRVQSLGLLTATIIHDFNNLLTPILCASTVLAAELEQGSHAATLAADIESVAVRATSLVRDVLAFARARPAAREVVDLSTVISAMRPLIERLFKGSAELVFELSDEKTRVEIDRGRLEHALLNMITNARNAMPDGGRLTIRTVSAPPYVALAVSDTGVGMTEQVQARAFDDFFTTRQAVGGTGLGLASVKRFAAESGGTVSLCSKVGRGTIVTLHLPIAIEQI